MPGNVCKCRSTYLIFFRNFKRSENGVYIRVGLALQDAGARGDDGSVNAGHVGHGLQ